MNIPQPPIGIYHDQLGYIELDRNDQRNKNQELFEAVKDNKLDLAETLITNKWLDVNEKNGVGETPIFFAVYNNNLEMVKLLVKHGAILDVITYCGSPLLLNCLRHKDNKIVKFLIDSGADVNVKDNGRSLLYFCIGDNSELLEFLLDRNDLDTNTRHGDWGTTPLLVAIQIGSIDIVRKLIKHGANVNLAEYNGTSPLDMAEDCKKDDIFKLLIDNGAQRHT